MKSTRNRNEAACEKAREGIVLTLRTGCPLSQEAKSHLEDEGCPDCLAVARSLALSTLMVPEECPEGAVLSDFALGDLSEGDALAVAAHVSACEECFAMVGAMKECMAEVAHAVEEATATKTAAAEVAHAVEKATETRIAAFHQESTGNRNLAKRFLMSQIFEDMSGRIAHLLDLFCGTLPELTAAFGDIQAAPDTGGLSPDAVDSDDHILETVRVSVVRMPQTSQRNTLVGVFDLHGPLSGSEKVYLRLDLLKGAATLDVGPGTLVPQGPKCWRLAFDDRWIDCAGCFFPASEYRLAITP